MPFMLSLTGRIHSRPGEYYAPEKAQYAAVIGPPERASRIAQQLSEESGECVQVAIVADVLVAGAGTKADIKVVSLERLVGLVRDGCVQRILLATPLRDSGRTAAILARLEG